MKNRYFNLLLLLPLLVLLVSGCNKGISIDSIKSAVMTEEICLKACDEKADRALADFKNCIRPYQDKLRTALNVCSHVPPANRIECEITALTAFDSDIEKCLQEYKSKVDEAKKCRKDCRDRFNLMMGINP